jgi:hypothetical protein
VDWAASFTISAFWHLMVLAVLALAVHPFQLPDTNRAVDLQLLPDLTLPPVPTVDLELKPSPDEPKPVPKAPPVQLRPATPEPPVALKPAEPEPQPVPPQPPPQLEVARPTAPELANPVEVQKRAVQAPRLQTQQAAPKISELPPEPVTVARPTAALPPPLEAPRAQAPSRPAPLDTSRAAPQISQAPATEAETPAPAAPQVLTNSTVIQAPVEIRPREAAPSAPRLETQGAAPQITAPAQGGAPPAGGGLGGGPTGGTREGSLKPYTGFNSPSGVYGTGRNGLRTDLGCENPDAYKLSAEDRAACLQRFGARGRSGPDLGLNISARKQAEYDHDVACHKAYTLQSIPGSASGSSSISINGLGNNPSLKECGPGER